MPDEETGAIEQAQDITAQETSGETSSDVAEVITDDPEVDYIEATVEGFDSPVVATVDKEAEDDTGDVKKQTPDTPADQEVTPKVEGPTTDYLQSELNQRNAHINNLNMALHQERAKAKEAKEEAENPLTEAQLRGLMKEHVDDPDTLYNIIDYQIKQGMKLTQQATIDATEVNQKKVAASRYINQQFPQLNNPGSNLRQNVDQIKQAADLGDHHMGDLAGLGLLFLNNVPSFSQQVFEAGKQEGLKGKAEGARKVGVKQATTAPAGKKAGKKSKSGLSGTALETAKQIGLSDSQMKLYGKFVGKKTQEQMMEAS